MLIIHFLSIYLSICLDICVLASELRCWYMMAMMLIFCMDSYPSIIIEHWVKYGSYLGGATRMVCEMQPVL
ncbi:hypothetical protein HanXRQr2_Chr05g0204621 [Helianthus annuus]|uniref:Uncharacterized protein n=1 Tax=Helianthus annuus TaxID=4232 RepID=A0A9K3IXQ2_HELAN|nr:hypothetical protein HanXRQr2_Chr05g0204621 [Helianthus annuus]KAJ0921914.1 hypothetical protein HanPSC8_Chr05g0197301 [Helianthus annuus]